MRVCDALLFRRGLPLYPVPSKVGSFAPWERWMSVGFELFQALDGSGSTARTPRGRGARVGEGALRAGRLCETYPDAVFCTLLGHRPPPKRTPWGLNQRIEVLRGKRVVDEDGGLWHRTLDELDACAAAYSASTLWRSDAGCWVGDPREGVGYRAARPGAPRPYTPLPQPQRATLLKIDADARQVSPVRVAVAEIRSARRRRAPDARARTSRCARAWWPRSWSGPSSRASA